MDTSPATAKRTPLQRIKRWLGSYLPEYFPVAWKMGLSISLLLVCGMAILGTLLLNNQLSHMREQADQFGHTIALQLAQTVREPLLADDQFLLKVQLNNHSSSDSVRGAALFDREGALLERAGILPLAASPTLPRVKRWELENEPVSTYYSTIMVNDLLAGYTAVTLSEAPILEAQKTIRDTMINATLIMSLLAIMAAFLISRRLAQPIHTLLAATSALRRGDYKFPITERRNDEIGGLIEAYNTMAHGLLEKAQVEKVLQRFVSPSVAKNMMADLNQVRLGGRHVEATVLFADIVGFTELAEDMPPEDVAEMLNVYFDAISTACTDYCGTIDKYMGDCAMVVFGVPEEDHEHLFHGLCCAVMIQRMVQRLNSWRRARGLITVEFRIGINAGTMLAGNLGSSERMQYTVVGDAVNLASRLSSTAGTGEIITAARLLEDPNLASRLRVSATSTIRVRGKSHPVATLRVEGVHPLSETLMEQRIAQFLARVEDTESGHAPA